MGPSSSLVRTPPSHGVSRHKPITSSYTIQLDPPDPGLVVKVYNYCINVLKNSEKTCRDRVNYLRKPLDPGNDHSVKAYRLFYRFIGKEPPKQLKTIKSSIDLRIPSDDEIIYSLYKVEDPVLKIIYRILIESGARLIEVVEVINGYQSLNDKRYTGFYTYMLNRQTKTKRSFYIFHVTLVEKTKVSYYRVEKQLRQIGVVRPKYVRKWVSTKMLSLKIPGEIINFIQGRTPRNILEKNYLDLYTLAIEYYPKYLEFLRALGVL